jgi:hypothetical protein
MRSPKSGESADLLREKAERCFRLAYETSDQRVCDLLVAYAHELLEQAKALGGDSESGNKGKPRR